MRYDENSAEMDSPMKASARYSGMGQNNLDKVTLQSAIQDTTLQAEKLAQMVMELLQRLEPVRSDSETIKEAAMSEAMIPRVQTEFGSPVALQVYRINDLIKRTQSSIARAMDDLDLQ